MKLVAARKTFNGGDVFLRDVFGSRDARPLGPSIDQDGAGATLALSAAVLGSSQIKILAQYCQKTDLRIRLNCVGTSVDSKLNRSHATPPNRERSKKLRPLTEMIHGVEDILIDSHCRHCGRPTFFTRAWKRGSERMES
jgi:hypothetical protein